MGKFGRLADCKSAIRQSATLRYEAAPSFAKDAVDGVGQLAEIHAEPRQLALAHELRGREDQHALLRRVRRADACDQRLVQGGVVARQPFLVRTVEKVDAVNVRLADEAVIQVGRVAVKKTYLASAS